MAGIIGVVITWADITAIMVTAFTVAVRATPVCMMAAAEDMAEVTEEAMAAEVTEAAVIKPA
jgi:hypothetical protein